MSNAVIASACCCGEEPCAGGCCDWWSCSPTAPINIVLTGSATTNIRILPGTQVLLTEEVTWTITATLTRSGSSCTPSGPPPYNNLFRYSAQTCNLAYSKKQYLRSVGESYTCRQLPWSPLFCGPVTYVGECVTWANPSAPFSGYDIGLYPCFDGTPPCNYYWTCLNASGNCIPPTSPGPECVPCGQNSNILSNWSSCEAYYLANGVWPEPSPRTGPNPCISWNCCFGARCSDSNSACSYEGCEDIRCPESPDEIEWRLQTVREWSYNGPITASGISCVPPPSSYCPVECSCPNSIVGLDCVSPPRGSPGNLVRPDDVLTIVCVETQCKEDGECAKPCLIFNPVTGDKFLDYVADSSMDPCCPYPCREPVDECVVESQEPLCIKPFAIFGRSACLNATTFRDPFTGCSMPPEGQSGGTLDMAGWFGCPVCQPINRTEEIGMSCNGGSNDPAKQGPSPYYCGVSNEGDLYCPEGCVCDQPPNPGSLCPPWPCTPEYGNIEYRKCSWPGWCELFERTVLWTWAM
jgi:hypothetical protein